MMDTASVGAIAQPEAGLLWALILASGAGIVLIYGDEDQKVSALASAAVSKGGAEAARYLLRNSAKPIFEVNKLRAENAAGLIMGEMVGNAVDD